MIFKIIKLERLTCFDRTGRHLDQTQQTLAETEAIGE